jgi:hypothetical protein
LIHNRVNYSVFSRVVDLVFPYVLRGDYPGRRAGLRELLGDRATDATIQLWRKTDRQPSWVNERLAEWMERDVERRLECARMLRALPYRSGKRGPGGGTIPHRLHAERLAREEAEREKALAQPSVADCGPENGKGELVRWLERRLGRPLD